MDPGASRPGAVGVSHPPQYYLNRKFQVKSAQVKKRFRYFRDPHVLKSLKDQAKVVAPLVKCDIP